MTASKIVLNAASGVGGEALNVEDVFSTYLYDGSSSAQTINNGIDLSGEGGMVWIKERSTSGSDHGVHDTERGVKNPIFTNLNNAENSYYNTNNLGITAFNSDGFTVASGSNFNDNGDTAVSWTFRKAPKFFTIVNYTGDGTTNRQISHDLGGTVGHITVKRTDTSAEWFNWHRTFSDNQLVAFSGTYAVGTYSNYLVTADSTTFTVGNNVDVNANGGTYVAYLWGHNDGDGDFGPNGDADIIKCGSYTGNGSSTGPSINLGFEPQWILTKRTDSTSQWTLVDNMRGMPVGGSDVRLYPNLTNADDPFAFVDVTPTGFNVATSASAYNASGGTYIYIAIRRGPMAVPESATDVFDVNLTTSNQFVTTGFPVDLQMSQYTGGGDTYVVDRMRGMSPDTGGTQQYLRTQSKNQQASNTGTIGYNGFTNTGFSHTLGNFEQANWSWRRAPEFFDIVAYDGNGQNNRQITHNLGVAPEMIIVKAFYTAGATVSWYVYHSGMDATAPEDYYMRIDQSDARTDEVLAWNDTAPTASNFTVSSLYNNINGSGRKYIAYLYATLDGISKVGSYTGNGSATGPTVDCGFSSGPRYVMIKEATGAGNWFVMDGAMGIVAGNDPRLILNTSNSKQSSDYIDPTSTGFQVSTSSANINSNGETYIFYAIA